MKKTKDNKIWLSKIIRYVVIIIIINVIIQYYDYEKGKGPQRTKEITKIQGIAKNLMKAIKKNLLISYTS